MEPTAMPGTGSGSTVVPVLDEHGPRESPAPEELHHVHGLRRVRLPAWTTRVMALSTAVALLGVSACGESTPRAPGCVTPSNEDALLDDYVADPILAFVPDGGHRTVPGKQVHGCVLGNMGEVSQTSALTIFDLSRDYDQAGVRAAFAAVTAGHGWAPDQLRQAALDQVWRSEYPDGQWPPYLAYCRQVRGVTTEANITVVGDSDPGPDGRVTNGQMEVWIAADPQRANCQAQVSDPHATSGLWD